MAMFGFANDDRTVDQVRFEEEGMMNFVARNDEPYRPNDVVNTTSPSTETHDEAQPIP